MKRFGVWANQRVWVSGFFVAVMAISTSFFLMRSQATHSLGFPLDDAWIHQTYARNLATNGEWAFLPGEVSAGSTSPIWTFLIAIAYGFSLPPVMWSYILGCVVLFFVTWLIRDQLISDLRDKPLLQLGLFVIVLFEWHLVWAALSGMETLLLGLHILLILRGLARNQSPFFLGSLAGLGIWIRPDAILTLIPIAWFFLVQHKTVRESALKAMKYAAGFVLVVGPYLVMNLVLGGEWWPSTFYAKQAEYAVARDVSFIDRLYKMSMAPLIGVGLLLIPGVLVAVIDHMRWRRWRRLAGFLWVVSFVAIYAMRLPVDYQHGRYMIPVIPELFLLGYEGLLIALRAGSRSAVLRVLTRSWTLSIFLVGFLFWIRGADAYAKDVAVIETEMVAASRWISANTGPEDLIAAHDIGALGYYGERRILDLAGLISPDVIPILRDEAALEALMNERGADYLMTFPDWYPRLVEGRSVVFSSGGLVSPSIGGENMTIYRWP